MFKLAFYTGDIYEGYGHTRSETYLEVEEDYLMM